MDVAPLFEAALKQPVTKEKFFAVVRFVLVQIFPMPMDLGCPGIFSGDWIELRDWFAAQESWTMGSA